MLKLATACTTKVFGIPMNTKNTLDTGGEYDYTYSIHYRWWLCPFREFWRTHENWRDAGCRERVEPVVVVQLEADGRKKVTKQEDSAFAKKMNLSDFGRRAIELFQLNGMEHTAQCHHG